MKITKTSSEGLNLIKSFEGFSAKAYKCPAGVWTIGYGTTRYPNGTKVAEGDKAITENDAMHYLKNDVAKFELYIDSYCVDTITQRQFDALVSFCYNLGPTNLKSSTLLKKVNKNPNDSTIRAEFLKWNKADGKALAGLTRRRTAEADLYFK